jgi:predicted esterase
MNRNQIKLDLPDVSVAAIIAQPEDAEAMVIFVHEIGASHSSPENNFVADVLNQNKLSTLIVDLLTDEESKNPKNRLDIDLLKTRLIRLTEKVMEQFTFKRIPVGYFGFGSGAAAAMDASVFLGDSIKAIVSQSGKTDLAMDVEKISAPILLINGSLDNDTIEINKKTYDRLRCDKNIEIVSGASRSFEDPDMLNKVAILASEWFDLFLCNKEVNENAH